VSNLDNLLTFLRQITIYFEDGEAPRENLIRIGFYMNSHLHPRIMYHVDTMNQKVYFYTEGYELYLGMASNIEEAIDCLIGLITEEVPNGSISEYRRISEQNLQKTEIII